MNTEQNSTHMVAPAASVEMPRKSLDMRRRSLSSASSSSTDKDAAIITPKSMQRSKKHNHDYTPDRCKHCLRQFTKLLQCKECYYCKHVVCAFCALKIPMFHSEKSKLGKHSLHARLCSACYDTNILNQNASNPSEETETMDDDGNIFLVEDSNDAGGELTAVSQNRIGLWLSLVTATSILGITIAEPFEYIYRAGAMVFLFIAFICIHPALSSTKGNSSNNNGSRESNSSQRKPSDCDPSASSGSESSETVELSIEDYRQRKSELEARFDELKLSSDWVKNESKSNASINLFEIDCGDAQPIFKVEAFIPDSTPEEMLAFLSSADPKIRRKWDTGMAANEVVETIDIDGKPLTVIHNTQKPHGFGLVSSRDFVLVAFEYGNNTFVQGVIDRPDVKIKSGVMRGQVHFISYECQPKENGFHMIYINHVDIGGSIPKKLVSNGTADNMIKMINMCIQSKKKWFS